MDTQSIIVKPAIGMVSPEDDSAIRHGRDTNKGFLVGRYLQAPPFFFTRDKWPLPLLDHYRGGTAFLIASGPSFLKVDHQKLKEPGILTMGLNNSPKILRPNLWTCVDTPANFLRSIWEDPTIQKIVPMDHAEKPVFDSTVWRMTDKRVGDCPNVVYYKRNERFIASQFLFEDSINWGNHTDWGGKRSCMLPALRILFLLGIRKIYLCGVDFQMDENYKYSFAQDRSKNSIKGNNETYEALMDRFAQMKPLFEENGLFIYNTNPESRLKVFDHVPFEDAYKEARGTLPADLTQEPTEGMYDRKAKEKKRAKEQAKQMAQMQPRSAHKPILMGAACDTASAKHIAQVKAQVKAAREALHEAKARTFALQATPNPDNMELQRLILDETQKRQIHQHLVAVRDSILGK